MRDLNYQLKQLCRHWRDGSYATRSHRERILTLIANELHAIGYRHMRANSLKPKHVEALVSHWQAKDLSIGTIKNRMSALRWWAEKIDKQSVVARSNRHYGIPDRCYVAKKSKAKEITQEQLDRIKDEHVRMSLKLQRAFGLRREEAIKFIPSHADQGNYIRVKGSWTKGGRPRAVPVRTEGQREILDRARDLAGSGSLIPSHRSCVQHLRVYENSTNRAGFSKLHGLRHAYAQERYEALTGWKSPVTGGFNRKSLSQEQRGQDREARLVISRELGHEREQVTAVYLGR